MSSLARAEACNNKGDKEYEKEEYFNAIDCYTEGIMVNCKDKNINAILFTNRANAHFRLGEYARKLIFFILEALDLLFFVKFTTYYCVLKLY